MPRSTCKKTVMSNIPEDIPNIRVPFPPNITAEEFLRSRPLSRAYFKSPNSFFIYRQQFVKQLKLENYNDQMIKVSKWASIFWSNEPKNVKQFYKNLEKKIQKLLKEQCDQNDFNSCQMICPKFIFEYPNIDEKREEVGFYDSPLPSVTDYLDVNTPDWILPTESPGSSNENSPIIPDELIDDNFDELMNFYPPFVTSPLSNDCYAVNNTEPVVNNDFEYFITMFDEMDVLNNLSSLPDNFVLHDMNHYPFDTKFNIE